MERLPVHLVTGFLGSGKTTLLCQLAETHREQRFLFLVNEFAEVDVDGAQLQSFGEASLSVVGGSLFCECKAGDFLRLMKETVLPLHHERGLDAVIIETSGIADPEAIGELMRSFGLEDHFEVCRIIAVASPKRLVSLVRNLPAVEAQVRTSDLIILNKCDLAPRSAIDESIAVVRELNPQADVVETEFCRVNVDLGLRRTADLPREPLAPCEANPFSNRTLQWPDGLSLDALRSWLEGLPASIVRVKGVVRAEGQIWRVERTVDSFSLIPAPEAEPIDLVLIAHDDDEDDLDDALAQAPQTSRQVASMK